MGACVRQALYTANRGAAKAGTAVKSIVPLLIAEPQCLCIEPLYMHAL